MYVCVCLGVCACVCVSVGEGCVQAPPSARVWHLTCEVNHSTSTVTIRS